MRHKNETELEGALQKHTLTILMLQPNLQAPPRAHWSQPEMCTVKQGAICSADPLLLWSKNHFRLLSSYSHLTKKHLVLLWAPLIGMALLRKLGPLPLYMAIAQKSGDHSSSHLWLLRLYIFLPCSLSLYTTHGNNHFCKRVSCGNNFVCDENCVTSSKLKLCQLTYCLPVATSGWLPPVWACMSFLFVFSFNAIQSDLYFLTALFHEERDEIRRRNWSASLIPFLIVWTQIKSLPFFSFIYCRYWMNKI